MKNLFIYAFFGLLFFACKTEPKRTDFKINGTAKGIYNGIRVHLNSINTQGKEYVIDTRMVVDERFSFEGKTEAPALHYITINSVPGKLPLMLENSEINIDIDASQLLNSKITGSKSHADFESYQAGYKDIEKDYSSITVDMRTAIMRQDLVKQDLLKKQLEEFEKRKTEYTIDFIKKNKDNFFSFYLIRLELNNPKVDIEQYLDVYNQLSSRLKTSKEGEEIKSKLEILYKTHQKIGHLEIGKIAPNFEAPNPDGTMVSLNQLKGKVTIIDFWAAWCGPCRRENPNVVNIYNKYHKQGLEIIGVSLDGSPTQKNPKQAWLEAVEKDGLTWTQLSNLQYFKEPVAQLYNITSIPATYIVDKDGRIVAKNLRGKALELKIEELLNK